MSRAVPRRAALAAFAGLLLCAVEVPAEMLEEAGQRLYRQGIAVSGQPLLGRVGPDVALHGARAACVNCHRRSGYGGVEGNRVVPPVTTGYLFGDPATPGSGLRATSFYDRATFQRALQEGRHVSGRMLSAPMPRYVLSDADLDALIAYLRTLTPSPPGVDDDEIHFATILTPSVPAQQRQALRDVLNAFVRAQNAERRLPVNPNVRAQLGHGRAYRATHQWRLHVWELTGPAHDWARQMDQYDRQQPVFAVLGGAARGDWQAVHVHCERRALPCLFPHVESADPGEGDHYSMYFSRGVLEEAAVLAHTLRSPSANGARRVVQVYRAHDSGAQAAQWLRRALADAPGIAIEDRVLTGPANLQDSRPQIFPTDDQTALVLWLRAEDLAKVSGQIGPVASVTISASLADDGLHALPMAWRSPTWVLLGRELPDAWQDRRRRLVTWLQAHNLTLTDERIQSNTYLMLTLVSRALTHMRTNLSREHLLERLEHLAQTGSWVSIYPELSLGPGQRIASRGGYRVPLQASGALAETAAWVVPDTRRPE